jgi:Protein of unknown function (DUF1257)
MSHMTTVQTQLKDLDAVRAACAALGWTLVAQQPVRYYQGPGPRCDYVLELTSEPQLARTYNLGLLRQADGTYQILCDNSMAGPVIREPGTLGGQTPRILGALKQQYARAVLTRQARRLGARVIERQQADGTILLTMQGGRLA